MKPRRLEHDDDVLTLVFEPVFGSDGICSRPVRVVTCSCLSRLTIPTENIHEATDWANDEGWRLRDDGTAACPRCVDRAEADAEALAREDEKRRPPR